MEFPIIFLNTIATPTNVNPNILKNNIGKMQIDLRNIKDIESAKIKNKS